MLSSSTFLVLVVSRLLFAKDSSLEEHAQFFLIGFGLSSASRERWDRPRVKPEAKGALDERVKKAGSEETENAWGTEEEDTYL